MSETVVPQEARPEVAGESSALTRAAPTTAQEWIRKIYDLRVEERKIATELKIYNAARKNAELDAAKFFAQEQVTSVKTEDGPCGYVRGFLFANKRKEVPDAVLAAHVEKLGEAWSALIKKKIHPSTLRAHIKEVVALERERRPDAEAIACLPVEIQSLIRIHEETRVVVVGGLLEDDGYSTIREEE